MAYIYCRMKHDKNDALLLPVRLLENHRAITPSGLTPSLETETEAYVEKAGPGSRLWGSRVIVEGLCVCSRSPRRCQKW